jgi:hypothetical protein
VEHRFNLVLEITVQGGVTADILGALGPRLGPGLVW